MDNQITLKAVRELLQPNVQPLELVADWMRPEVSDSLITVGHIGGVCGKRTKAGLDAARQEGRVGGRRPKLSPQQQDEIRKMIAEGGRTAADVARLFKVHPATVSRLLARQANSVPSKPRRAK